MPRSRLTPPSWLAWVAVPLLFAPPCHAQTLLDQVAKLPSGNGFSASTLCTRVNASGDDFAVVRDRHVAPLTQPLPQFWGITHWPGVFTSVNALIPFFTHTRTAVYRKGLGCTVVPPGSVSATSVLAQSWRVAVAPPVSTAPWPQGEGAAQADGLSDAARTTLATVSQSLMDEKPGAAADEAQNTIAVLVAKDGRLIHERYADRYHQDQPQLGHSMTKALTALIAGRMIAQGHFTLDDHPPVPQLSEGGKQAITWRHLLTNSSGLAWTEGYIGQTTMARMLYDEGQQAAFSASQALSHPPGQVFNYSTGSFGIVSQGMREKLGGTAQAAYDHYQTQLFAPLGIRNGVIEVDVQGTPIGGSRGVLRPRDWLRLGQLILNEGQWNGATLVPREHIAFMKTPSPATVDEQGNTPAYGGGLCLRKPTMPPEMPADLVYLCGSFGQTLMLVPSRNLAVLRMGVSMPRADTQERMVQAVLALLRTLP